MVKKSRSCQKRKEKEKQKKKRNSECVCLSAFMGVFWMKPRKKHGKKNCLKEGAVSWRGIEEIKTKCKRREWWR
jgi:hypothetical protein